MLGSRGVVLAGLLVAGCSVAPAPRSHEWPPPPSGDTPPTGVGLTGTWYLDRAGTRLQAEIQVDAQAGTLSGSLSPEPSGPAETVDHVGWDPESGAVQLRSAAGWIAGRVVEGVLVGRFAKGAGGDAPPEATAFADHVTGWRAESFAATLPRVYELLLDDRKRARLRLDGDGGALVGRLKVYADVSTGAAGEELEYDLDAVSWDGTSLHFATHGGDRERAYDATAHGRFLTGTYVDLADPGAGSFTGSRAEILGFGLRERTETDRATWQSRTRAQLRHLIMAGDPAPISRAVTVIGTVPPTVSTMLAVDRDDDPGAHAQAYQVTEIDLDHALPDPLGGAPLVRRSHGRLFVPTQAPPPGGFPAVLALNGHTGSSLRMSDPDDIKYWFGDGFARRGFVVLALDVSHRPLEDRRGLYSDFLMGDSPMGGNVSHPAIKSPGLDSDWEEDGERAWDALRGLEYLRSLPEVDGARLVVTGHSMGAEVASYVGALAEDARVTVMSAPSVDLGVMLHHGNHPCWQWLDADVREYLDMSDLHALNAPRALVIETGKTDGTYSQLSAPWAGSKQVARRTLVAYAGAAGRFVHYLHYDQHHYHVGDVDPTKAIEEGVRVPALQGPAAPWSLDWQTDGATSGSGTLFDLIASQLGP